MQRQHRYAGIPAWGTAVVLIAAVGVSGLAGSVPAVNAAEAKSATHLAAATEEAAGALGSTQSKVYHLLLSCPFAQRIRDDQRVSFDSAQAAEAAGRRPCKRCLKAAGSGT